MAQFRSLALLALLSSASPAVLLAQQGQQLPGTSAVTKIELNTTMRGAQCLQMSKQLVGKNLFCGCKTIPDSFCTKRDFRTGICGDDVVNASNPNVERYNLPCRIGTAVVTNIYKYSYWEPAAFVEVSCRKGGSLLNKGKIPGGEPNDQACFVPTGANGGRRWFFHARVWGISANDNGTRVQAVGKNNDYQLRACDVDGRDSKKDNRFGYGVKWGQFQTGPVNGPGNSWEAYISDNDPSWVADSGGGSQPPTEKGCKGGVDLEGCWGPVTTNGWVSHPNQAVAAALVSWRALQKAKGKISPPGADGQYKMNMEYPYLNNTGAYASSMGMGGNGGKRGGACFAPGESSSKWYTFGERDIKPEAIPAFIQGLKTGSAGTVEVNQGVYVFTYWVKTTCKRFDNVMKGGKRPGPIGVRPLSEVPETCTYADGT
jgi:hypothetical protein